MLRDLSRALRKCAPPPPRPSAQPPTPPSALTMSQNQALPTPAQPPETSLLRPWPDL